MIIERGACSLSRALDQSFKVFDHVDSLLDFGVQPYLGRCCESMRRGVFFGIP